jgi:hypothetical protein
MAEKGDLRRHGRIQAGSIVELVWKDRLGNEKFTKARALDISESGMRVEVPEQISEGSYVTFRADELALHGRGSVKTCRGKGIRYVVGLEFSGGMKWKPKTAKGKPAESIGEDLVTPTTFR